MKEITIEIGRQNVYDEVVKTTSYVGAKLVDADGNADENGYDRVSATNYDGEIFARFWLEACGDATNLFKEYIKVEVDYTDSDSDDYRIILGMPGNFASAVLPSMRASLFSFFVNYIASKWFEIAYPSGAKSYRAEAEQALLSVKDKMYHRIRA